MGHHILKSIPESPFIYTVPILCITQYMTTYFCVNGFSGRGTHQILMEICLNGVGHTIVI